MRKLTSLLLFAVLATAAHGQVSDAPQTPFKLASFEAQGTARLGLVVGDRLLDIHAANAQLQREAGLPAVEISQDMRSLIEEYDRVRARLYQIANFFADGSASLPFAFDPEAVSIKAPVKYPWHLIAAAINYRAHAEEMGSGREVDPERDAPYLFAKSPRANIVDPGLPYVIPPGRENIDWEGEFVIVVGRQASRVTLQNAMDHVFGFTIMYDVSDRAPQYRETPAYTADWFSAKNRDGSAPMGPYVVPKEFFPNYKQARITTKVNGRVVQDSDTSYQIYDVEHLMRYVTSIQTLYPGDMIATGTPPGVGHGRTPPEYLKPGDVVTIEVEGIGVLSTPIK